MFALGGANMPGWLCNLFRVWVLHLLIAAAVRGSTLCALHLWPLAGSFSAAAC
jgi:hypothetical protein